MIRFNTIVAVIAALALATFSNCDGPTPTPQETDAVKNTKILSTGGTWSVQSVTVNGVDQTSVYKDLKITFSSSGFTAVNGGASWPTSGSWSFTSDAGTTIHRVDGLDLAINEISEHKLVLSFNWATTTLGPGRTKSVAGAHVVTLTR
jgi:hypothetical protein